MSPERNFIFTIIAITFVLVAGVIYIILNIEPNIFWLIGLLLLVAITVTHIFSIIFFMFSKLRSFETPRQMYRRQVKKSVIFGILSIGVLLAQKFFDLL